jgi:peptidoglycan/LPS O-acetylase OafA/YrhL
MVAHSHLTTTILDHYRKPRVLGLDILRIIASASIILYHANLKPFGQSLFTEQFRTNGYLAVDIFFVLSGWLLTRQVLRMRKTFASPLALAPRFWTRRWARTLPPYWVMLVVIVLVWPWLDPNMFPVPISWSDLPRHALFLQTIIGPSAYGVSWSLVAEEWFYLALPFAVFFLGRARSWRVVVAFCLAILLVPSVERIIIFTSPIEPWRILTLPHVRFDGLVVGALLAAASLGAPWWHSQIMARRRILFGAGLVMAAGILAAGAYDTWPYRVFGVLAFCVSIGMLMPLMSQLRWPLATPAAAVITIAFLSELTYPLYLIHPLIRIHWSHFPLPLSAILLVLAVFVLFASATLLHLAVERPSLALRERFERRGAGVLHVTEGPAAWKEPPGEALPAPAGTAPEGAPIVTDAAPIVTDAALAPNAAT